MRSWNSLSYNEKLNDGTERKVYRLTFETDEKGVAKGIEEYFQILMDEKEQTE